MKIERKIAAAVLPGAGKSVFRKKKKKKVPGKTRGKEREVGRGKSAAQLLWSLQCKLSRASYLSKSRASSWITWDSRKGV